MLTCIADVIERLEHCSTQQESLDAYFTGLLINAGEPPSYIRNKNYILLAKFYLISQANVIRKTGALISLAHCKATN